MKEGMVLLIVGMAIVTFLPRFIPLAFLTRWVIPEKVKMGLEYIPIAIMSAILFPMLFANGERAFQIQPQYIITAIPVFVFAWKMKNVWLSIILGMAIFWGLGFVL